MSKVRPRVVVITGAASGIGAASARRFEAAGYRVIRADRSAEGMDVVADLSTPQGRAGSIEDIIAISEGYVDAVVAAAGTAGQGVIDVQVDFFGAVATLDGLRPLLAQGQDPRAVVIASVAAIDRVDAAVVEACMAGDEAAAIAAVQASPAKNPMAPYASAKRAVARWVRRHAPTPQWAGAGIALNAIAPGIIRTPLTAPMLAHAPTAAGLDQSVPMPYGGVAEPDAVVNAIEFLLRPDVGSITGQTLFVDGGADCVKRGDDIFG